MFDLEEVVSDDQKEDRLTAVIDSPWPGRSKLLRPILPRGEGALILHLRVAKASAIIRSGLPKNEPDDDALPIWSGVVPMATRFSPAIHDPRNQKNMMVPKQLQPARTGQ